MIRRSTLRSTFWSIAASGATSVAGMVSGVLLARALGPTARGEFAAVVSWVGVLGMLSDLGVSFAVSYYAGREPGRIDTLYSQGIVAALLLRGAAWLTGGVALQFVPAVAGLGAATSWVALSSVMAGGLSGVVLSLFLGTGRVRAVNLITLAGAWAYAGGIVALWATGERRVPVYVCLFAATQALVCAVAQWLGRRLGKFRWHWSSSGLRQVFGYGLKSQFASLAAQANLRLDQVLMSVLVPSGDLGYYVVAVALSSMTTPIYSGLNVILTPRVIGAPSQTAGALWGIRMSLLGAVLGGIGTLALALVAPWLLSLLFGSRYEGSLQMARLLLVAAVFQGLNLLLGTTLRGLNRPGAQGRAEGVGAVATVGLLLILLPRLGGMGAAIASLVTYAMVSAIELAMILRAGGLHISDVRADVREHVRALLLRWGRGNA